ncbi:MAG: hypothetical protein ACRDBY_14395 [Cetobacterium sp.]
MQIFKHKVLELKYVKNDLEDILKEYKEEAIQLNVIKEIVYWGNSVRYRAVVEVVNELGFIDEVYSFRIVCNITHKEVYKDVSIELLNKAYDELVTFITKEFKNEYINTKDNIKVGI